jgi:integration host factor subunit alpha
MSKTLTRADLTEAVYRSVGLSRNESSDLVEAVIEEICSCLESNEEVKLSSFGTFSVQSKTERVGRNPKRASRLLSPHVGCYLSNRRIF